MNKKLIKIPNYDVYLKTKKPPSVLAPRSFTCSYISLHERVADRPVTATVQIYFFFVRSRPHRYLEALAHSQLKLLVVLLPPPPRPPLLSLPQALAGCGIRISIRTPYPSIPAASPGASALNAQATMLAPSAAGRSA